VLEHHHRLERRASASCRLAEVNINLLACLVSHLGEWRFARRLSCRHLQPVYIGPRRTATLASHESLVRREIDREAIARSRPFANQSWGFAYFLKVLPASCTRSTRREIWTTVNRPADKRKRQLRSSPHETSVAFCTRLGTYLPLVLSQRYRSMSPLSSKAWYFRSAQFRR